MDHRVLSFRLAFAATGAGTLIAGALLDLPWLVVAACAGLLVSEAVGLSQLRKPLATPALSLARTACEVLPSVAVAAVAVQALGVAVSVAVYAVFAAGIHTVSVSRGAPLARKPGEGLRRLFTSGANVLLVLVAGIPATGHRVQAVLGTEADAVVWLAVAVAALVSLRAITDLGLELRRTREAD